MLTQSAPVVDGSLTDTHVRMSPGTGWLRSRLPPAHSVVCPDPRGYGKSAEPVTDAGPTSPHTWYRGSAAQTGPEVHKDCRAVLGTDREHDDAGRGAGRDRAEGGP